MWKEVNLTDERTVYLNSDAVAYIEKGTGGHAVIRLMDGTEYSTNEDYEELLGLLGISKGFEELVEDAADRARYQRALVKAIGEKYPELVEYIK